MRFLDEYNILRKKQNKRSGFAATALLASLAVILLLVGLFVFLLGRVNKNKVDSEDKTSGNTTEVVDNGENSQSTGTENTQVCDENGKCTVICNSKESVFNNNLRTIKDAAVSYYTNERLPQKVGETKKITLKEMQEEKLVISTVDSNKNVSLCST